MRFIHTGDLHIGKIVNEYSMLENQEEVLAEILKIAKEEKVDGVILAGDIYDRAIPPAEGVKLLSDFITELSKEQIEVFLISGNHDSPERLGFAKELLKETGLHIAGEFKREVEKVVIQDEFGPINLYLLPFARPQVMNYFGYEGNGFASCVKNVLEKLKIDNKERNILVAHHFVAGGGVALEESESEYPLSVGGIDQVDYHSMERFDYVALGHIHGPQKVGKETIRYSGSPIKYSFSETYHNKSVVMVELREKGNVSVSLRGLTGGRDMRMIRGRLKELMSEDVVSSANSDDYLHVTLTDTEEILDPLGKLRTVYPNVMQLVLEKNVRKEEDREIKSTHIKGKSTLAVFQEFYEKVTEGVLSETARKAVIEAIEEVSGYGEV